MYKGIRLLIYSAIITPLGILLSSLRHQDLGEFNWTWQWITAFILVGLFLCLFIYDIVYFRQRGKTQPCIHCGYEREMKPFRIYGTCPGCSR